MTSLWEDVLFGVIFVVTIVGAVAIGGGVFVLLLPMAPVPCAILGGMTAGLVWCVSGSIVLGRLL